MTKRAQAAYDDILRLVRQHRDHMFIRSTVIVLIGAGGGFLTQGPAVALTLVWVAGVFATLGVAEHALVPSTLRARLAPVQDEEALERISAWLRAAPPALRTVQTVGQLALNGVCECTIAVGRDRR
jgi:hypothetical protein